MLIRNASNICMGMALISVLISCVPVSSQRSLILDDSNLESMNSFELMSIYGEWLRANHREENTKFISDRALIAIEQQIEKRKLLSAKGAGEVSEGLLYLAMPVSQLMASVSGLSLVEQVPFGGFALELYRANGPIAGKRRGRTVALVCNERIIGLSTIGTTTFDTWRGVSNSNSKVRSNFSPGYFSGNSAVARRWIESGSMPPKPTDKHLAARGERGLILDLRGRSSLQSRLEYYVNAGQFPRLKKYFGRVC